jgi:hypothetical protein
MAPAIRHNAATATATLSNINTNIATGAAISRPASMTEIDLRNICLSRVSVEPEYLRQGEQFDHVNTLAADHIRYGIPRRTALMA